jgi:hypothetical protein
LLHFDSTDRCRPASDIRCPELAATEQSIALTARDRAETVGIRFDEHRHAVPTGIEGINVHARRVRDSLSQQ